MTTDSLSSLVDPAIPDRAFTRRSLVKSLAGLGVAAAVLTPALALVSPTAARSTDSLIVNTSGARLRSGPGTGYRTLASLAKGTEVRFLDGGTNPDPVIIGNAWTIAAINLRTGPSTGNQVLRVVPSGARIGVSNTVQNGFRYVSHNGLAGWIFDAYISFSDGTSQPETFTTTAALNLGRADARGPHGNLSRDRRGAPGQ